MYTREELATKICGNENGGEFLLKYYLTSKKSETESKATLIYGIEIEKYALAETGEQSFSEMNAATGLSYDAESVKAALGKLARGRVTPVSLDCVLDDMETAV